MTRILASMLAAVGLIASTGPLLAQSAGPNGGLVQGSGSRGHQTELVVRPTELTVYMLENGKPHDSKGMSMRAVIQQSGKTATVNFVDEQGKKLVAKLPAPLDKGAIVVLTGKDHHGDQFTARYVIK
jgi:cytochrome c-type biogenesis protein CcmE